MSRGGRIICCWVAVSHYVYWMAEVAGASSEIVGAWRCLCLFTRYVVWSATDCSSDRAIALVNCSLSGGDISSIGIFLIYNTSPITPAHPSPQLHVPPFTVTFIHRVGSRIFKLRDLKQLCYGTMASMCSPPSSPTNGTRQSPYMYQSTSSCYQYQSSATLAYAADHALSPATRLTDASHDLGR